MRTTRSGESVLLLLDVIDVLVSRQINYAVIGALAASIHGAVRASMDADAVLSMALPEVEQLDGIFKALGFQSQLSRGDFDDDIAAVLRLHDSHDNQVDLLIGLRGLELEAFSRAIDVPLEGKLLRFIGREDFIAMKVAAGGPVDLRDAENALLAGRKSIDMPLLQRLAARYGRAAAKSLQGLLDQEARAGIEVARDRSAQQDGALSLEEEQRQESKREQGRDDDFSQ